MEQIVKLLEHIGNEEVAEDPVRPIGPRDVSTDPIAKERDVHFVVATLVATVTFAAAVTVPGGYKSEEGKDQGTPFLIHEAFKLTDALAFFLSLSAFTVTFVFVCSVE
ncbi:hypothetical protein HRI_004651100 [Hibiscus trionum]|uniref:PGG domain-containing protein n=1 Tax=Hibiscus trionum TaxID=183268 RepID=A0A9W7MPF4_HIBTR|nr:hypothetical protein HRI_004651100 [Hibiscus trionum]